MGVTNAFEAPAEVQLVAQHDQDDEQILQVTAELQLVPKNYDVPVATALFTDQAQWVNVRIAFVAANAYQLPRL